jgi:formylglycine-generating enzyme required for sulfatase activity
MLQPHLEENAVIRPFNAGGRCLRIFLSSPGDVAAEREIADATLADLERSPAWRGKFRFEIIRWDDPHAAVPMDAHVSPQDAINQHMPKPSECDIVAVMLWARMGTPLFQPRKPDGSPYLSGTEWEFFDALEGKACVLLFRRLDKPRVELGDPDYEAKVDQYQNVQRFFAALTDSDSSRARSVISYEGTSSFGRLFRQSVEGLLRQIDEHEAADPGTSGIVVTLRPRDTDPNLPDTPYPLLQPYTHPKTLAGRDSELIKLESLVGQHQLILCLHGASGTGKSSLLLAGLAPRLRASGFPVSFERHPGEPGLASRLLKDILELPPSVSVPEDGEFAAWLSHARTLAGKPPILILDQIDDMLRQPKLESESALAQLGPLLAATAKRLPGEGGFMCRWLLCYRQEFHGEVSEWLQDVLSQARRAGRGAGLGELPHDLTGEHVHNWAVPLMGSAAPGEDEGAAACRAFLDAIERPLSLRRQDGGPQYAVRFDEQGAERLACAFARARVRQPSAPLVPELQVVLAHLLDRASCGPAGESVVHVPDDDIALDEQITQALAAHLARAISEAFPLGRDASAGRSGRARALLALRELVDDHGLRGQGRTHEELVQAIGAGGDEVIEKLASPAMRLIVREEQGHAWVYVLTHDRLAEVVKTFVDSETARGSLGLDRRVVELRQLIAQKSELYLRLQDESALTLSREDHDLIEAATPAFFLDDSQRHWWHASHEWFAVTSALLRDPGAGFKALLALTEKPGTDWVRIDRRLRLVNVDPKVFWEGPWAEGGRDGSVGAEVMRVVDRTHQAFLESPEHLRAMNFAVEEVVRRWPDHANRGRELRRVLRDAALRQSGLPARFRGDAWFLPDEGIDGDAQSLPGTVGLGFVEIPDGWFEMGSDRSQDSDASDDELWIADPARRGLTLPTFAIGRYPVTVAQFRVFADAVGRENAEALCGVPDHPVVYVTWYEALAYCMWLEAELRKSPQTPAKLRGFLESGAHIVLPSEAEWEKAARGTDGRIYPWTGISIDPSRANYIGSRVGHTTPVGAYPSGASPYGVLDLSGNVWEWTRSLWGKDRDKPSFLYPYKPDDGRENLYADRGIARVVRGGAFSRHAQYVRAAFRHRGDPHNRHINFGFRVAVSRFTSHL